MSSNDEDLLIIQGARYWKAKRWAKDKKVHVRTVDRHRQLGLPWMEWGGEIYIPEEQGDEYVAARVKRRNPPRRRKAIAASPEIGAAS
jgi:hypothetical protein